MLVSLDDCYRILKHMKWIRNSQVNDIVLKDSISFVTALILLDTAIL